MIKPFTNRDLLFQLVHDTVTVATSGSLPTKLVPGQCTPQQARRELAKHLEEYGQRWIEGLHQNLLNTRVTYRTDTPEDYGVEADNPPIPSYNERERIGQDEEF